MVGCVALVFGVLAIWQPWGYTSAELIDNDIIVDNPVLPSEKENSTNTKPVEPDTEENQITESSSAQGRPERKKNGTMLHAQDRASTTTGTINGHEYVDLGLSVKWATKNVGASSPSDYGYYFAWGETSKKDRYYKSNSKTWEKSLGGISGNAQYDAARANWGGTWRLPTENEWRELVDRCTWSWTFQGVHFGYRVTSKANGNSIFLPAAGSRFGTSLNRDGEYGGYWSSTSYGIPQRAYDLYFNSSRHGVDLGYRYVGRSVRPVSE